MGAVRGCNIPEDLIYNIENNVWARQEGDGNLTIGLTAYACSLAGDMVACTSKKVGKEISQDRSCATVESGKWVGPVKVPVTAVIVAVNPALLAKPDLINKDPYGEGWIVKVKPVDFAREAGNLKTGAEALAAFEAKMQVEGFKGC